jgi:AcrR family transcriptional regulator
MDSQVQQNQTVESVECPCPSPPQSAPGEIVDSPCVRERVLREATRLFAAKGFNGVSVREIVEAAGVTKPTLYYYFSNKEKLFREIVVASLMDFQERLEAAVGQPGSIRESLARIAGLYIDFAREHGGESRITYSLYFSSERNLILDFDFNAYFTKHIEMIGGVVAQAVTRNEVRSGDPWLMAFSFVGILNLFIMGILYNPAVIPAEGLAELIADAALRGLAGPALDTYGAQP